MCELAPRWAAPQKRPPTYQTSAEGVNPLRAPGRPPNWPGDPKSPNSIRIRTLGLQRPFRRTVVRRPRRCLTRPRIRFIKASNAGRGRSLLFVPITGHTGDKEMAGTDLPPAPRAQLFGFERPNSLRAVIQDYAVSLVARHNMTGV